MTALIPMPEPMPEPTPTVAVPAYPLPDIKVDGYTFDCTLETLVQRGTDGNHYHYPATGDEIVNHCGYLPTIPRTDADWVNGPLLITTPDGLPLELPTLPALPETTTSTSTSTPPAYDGPQLAATGITDSVGLITIALGSLALATIGIIAAIIGAIAERRQTKATDRAR